MRAGEIQALILSHPVLAVLFRVSSNCQQCIYALLQRVRYGWPALAGWTEELTLSHPVLAVLF